MSARLTDDELRAGLAALANAEPGTLPPEWGDVVGEAPAIVAELLELRARLADPPRPMRRDWRPGWIFLRGWGRDADGSDQPCITAYDEPGGSVVVDTMSVFAPNVCVMFRIQAVQCATVAAIEPCLTRMVCEVVSDDR